VIVNYMRDYQLGLGMPRAQVYNQTMLILGGLLVVGLICNLLIRPVAEKWFMHPEEAEAENRLLENKPLPSQQYTKVAEQPSHPVAVVVAWACVITPMAWGVYKTVLTVSKLFV